MKFHTKVTGTVIIISLPADEGEPPAEQLVLDLAIECEVCGTHQVRIAGHHLKQMRDLLMEVIDRNPTLCGPDGGNRVTERLEYQGRAPKDPSVN